MRRTGPLAAPAPLPLLTALAVVSGLGASACTGMTAARGGVILVRRSHGMELGQGHLIRMSGGRATDSPTTTALDAQLGNQSTVAADVTLVQDGRPGRSTRSRWDE